MPRGVPLSSSGTNYCTEQKPSHCERPLSSQLNTALLLPSFHHTQNPPNSSCVQSMNQQQRQQRHNIHVLFLEDQKGDHILNRLTAMLGKRIHKNQGFCHVEIVIPDASTGEYLSSSIYNGETVTLSRTKTFANPGYTVMTFTVDGIELSSIADYLHDSKRMQLGFDSLGMYLAALPFQVNPFASRSNKTFCSKHVTLALKRAGIEAVQGLNENIVTPSKLYKVLHEGLRKDRFVVGSVQYKQKALAEGGALFVIQ